jgi:hypothetical protein
VKVAAASIAKAFGGTNMIETIETGSAKVVGWKLHGTLHDEDYQRFLPQVESILTSQGKVRLFVQFEDFQGWDLHAAWDDVKFGMRHYSDFERIAMVGDREWEKWMAALSKPFTGAKVRYFDRSQIEEAWHWLHEEGPAEPELNGPELNGPEMNGKNRTPDFSEEPEAWRGFPWYGF